MIMSPRSRIVVALSLRPRPVMDLAAVLAHRWPVLKSATDSHGMSPSQYSGMEVLGVPPPIISIASASGVRLHLPAIPNLLQVGANHRIKAGGFLRLLLEPRGQ